MKKKEVTGKERNNKSPIHFDIISVYFYDKIIRILYIIIIRKRFI